MFPVEEPSAPNSGFRALLKNRSFLALWSGQVVSQVADKIFFILLTIPLLESYPSPSNWGANSVRSVLLIACTLPAILFGSAAGIFVDRFQKKQVLEVCNWSRGLLILSLPLLPKLYIVLILIAFCESVMTQFFAPAEQAAIPLVVKKESLLSANALFTTTMMGAVIVGFAVGEPLLALAETWGESGQEILVGGLYLLAAAVFYLMPLQEVRSTDAQIEVHPWHDFKAGLAYLRQNRLVSNAMIQLTALYSVFAAMTVLAVELGSKIGLESNKYALLATAGIGMVLGAGILGHWGDRFHHKPLPLIGFLSMAIALAVFSFSDSVVIGLGISVFLGLGAALIGVPMQTVIQQQTPASMHGKVFGFQNNAINIALSLPLAITGPLTDALGNWVGSAALGLQLVLLGMSVFVTLVGVWAWHNTRRVLRNVI
ncbi:MFS transporter [Aliterella atlantica]|uniref:MFS transporter n=1 Tax=Aliterella atlantica CENA595 TaxID=1618023 RepID=A0A0D8ZTX4_9CYAN|nr:MFS transporter [Aliterella atlantica]KJH71924.1 MFS transporter [Aliterella atlantica CENA595]